MMTGTTLESYLVEIVDCIKQLTAAVVVGLFVVVCVVLAGRMK